MSSAAFTHIAPGSFSMGSPERERGRAEEERLHAVTLTRAFLIKTTLVTQAEWKAAMGNNPSRFPHAGEASPVSGVCWFDALVYANLLSERAGLEPHYALEGFSGTPGAGDFQVTRVWAKGAHNTGYRLPTEAEWEYACRAGTTGATWRGELTLPGKRNDPALDAIAWYGGNSEASYPGAYDCSSWPEKQRASMVRCGPQPVGGKEPNPWGLCDMLGNLNEWVQDAWAPYSGDAIDPVVDGEAASKRVVRGGSWFGPAQDCRAAFRFRLPARLGYDTVGFRLVRTVG